MIVECGNCQTRFQLDDSRVPERGIRVRCSRCKEAFFLESPNASRSEAVDDVVVEAVAGGAPDVTQDLPVDTAMEDAVPGEEQAFDHEHGRGEDEESDWEFNESLPGQEAGADEGFDAEFDASEDALDPNVDSIADSLPDPSAVSFDDEDESGLELDLGRNTTSGVDALEAPGGDADDAAPFEEPAPELEQPAPVAADPVQVEVQQEEEDDDDDPFGEAADFSALIDEEPAPEASIAEAPVPDLEPPAAEEVGEPEDWDFFSEEADASAGPLLGADAVVAPPAERVPLGSGPSVAALDANAGASGEAVGGARTLGRGIGWTIAISLLAVGVAQGILRGSGAVQWTPTVAELGSPSHGQGSFHAEQVRGVWLDTARAGTVYVVTGQLVNDAGRPLPLGDRLSVALLGHGGARLATPPAPASLPQSESQLRELPLTELVAAADRSSWELARSVVAPRSGLTFQAVFHDVPDAAASFVLEFDAAAPPAEEAPREAFDPATRIEREADSLGGGVALDLLGSEAGAAVGLSLELDAGAPGAGSSTRPAGVRTPTSRP